MNRRHRQLGLLGVPLLVVAFAACDSDATDDAGSTAPTTVDATMTPSTVPTTTLAGDDGTDTAVVDDTTPGEDTTATDTTPTPPAPDTTVPDATVSETTTTTMPTPDATPHVVVGSDRYPFEPTECLVFDGVEAVITGPGTAPDGSPVFVAIDVGDGGQGGILIDLDSDHPFDRSQNTVVAGVGTTEDDFTASITGQLVEVTANFVAPNEAEPIAGSVEVDCGQ